MGPAFAGVALSTSQSPFCSLLLQLTVSRQRRPAHHVCKYLWRSLDDHDDPFCLRFPMARFL